MSSRKKYLFLTLRVDFNNSEPWFGNDVTDMTLSKYIIESHMEGRKQTILFVHEINKRDYEKLKPKYESE